MKVKYVRDSMYDAFSDGIDCPVYMKFCVFFIL